MPLGDFLRSSWDAIRRLRPWLCATLIGQKCAAELILTGRQFTGDEAAAIGFADPIRGG